MADTATLVLSIPTIEVFCACYMPFIQGLALFIPTDHQYEIGTVVELNLQLPGELENKSVKGEVIWVTFPNNIYLQPAGVGIKIDPQQAKWIDNLINGVDSGITTRSYTM